jgi:hypothetical protein
MLLNSVDPEKWYKIREVAVISGWSVDTIRRWIRKGFLKAFLQPTVSNRRKRKWQGMKVLGRHLLDFLGGNMSGV